jgi:hypothetical protein
MGWDAGAVKVLALQSVWFWVRLNFNAGVVQW